MGIAWLWGSFLILTVASVLLFRVRSAKQSILGWPQVRGIVEPGSVVFKQVGWLPPFEKKGLSITAVSFEYEVAGNKHKGCRVAPVGWTISDAEQNRVRGDLEKYSTVLYNPDDPADSYLDVPDRFQRGSISWLTVELAVSVFGAVLLGLALLMD